jgi:uncharacterized membrane protein
MGVLQVAGRGYLMYKIISLYFVSIIFVVLGIVLVNISKSDKRTKTTRVTLSDINCSADSCSATGQYNVNGSSYSTPVQYGAKDTSPHSDIYYDPNKPSDATLSKLPSWVGLSFMGIGTLLLLVAFIMTMFAMNSSANNQATAGGLLAGMNTLHYLQSK